MAGVWLIHADQDRDHWWAAVTFGSYKQQAILLNQNENPRQVLIKIYVFGKKKWKDRYIESLIIPHDRLEQVINIVHKVGQNGKTSSCLEEEWSRWYNDDDCYGILNNN
jgi:hypothetical protein